MKKLFTLLVFVTTLSTGFAQTCDTLFNLQSNLDTATVYLADTGTGAGYLSGNNLYGDLAKAEGFAAVTGDYVNSAVLFFGVVTINPTDSNNTVTVYVWDNTGASIEGNNDAPGNALDSATVTLGQIAQAVTSYYNTGVPEGLLVNFKGGVALTTDSFYVGVVLPAVTGDTVALFTNEVPPGPDGNGWEYEANYETGIGYIWGSYNDDWGFTGGSEGNFIAVNICSTAPAGTPFAAFTAANTTGNSVGCTPDTVNFTDNSTATPSPSAWGWSFGDGTTSSAQNPSHVYTTGGTYVVTESVTNNLGSIIQAFVSATDTVTVQASLSITLQVTDASSSSSNNGTINTSVTGGGGQSYTYAWSNDSTGAGISNLAPGTYYVTVTGQNSCTTVDTAYIGITGILDLSNGQQVKIYPNPATDVLNLAWSQKPNDEVSILDLNGQVIGTFEAIGEMNSTYNVHDLAAGTYILRITDKASNQQQSTLFSKF